VTARRLVSVPASAVLPPVAAFAVHQLRYLLAFGDGASREFERTGHSYLHSVVSWVVLLAALGLGVFLRRLGQACAGRTSPAHLTASFAGLWMACAVSLVAIFVLQELIEGLLATGHAVGPALVFAHGGWWSLPASGCVGLMLAAILHGARWSLTRSPGQTPVPCHPGGVSDCSLPVGPVPRWRRPDPCGAIGQTAAHLYSGAGGIVRRRGPGLEPR
jgi:hypothetical protein